MNRDIGKITGNAVSLAIYTVVLVQALKIVYLVVVQGLSETQDVTIVFLMGFLISVVIDALGRRLKEFEKFF